MNIKLRRIKRLTALANRAMFHSSSTLGYERLVEVILRLSDAVAEYPYDDADVWQLDTNGVCDITDIIIGAYWHYSAWGWGDTAPVTNSLNAIFTPGMSEPEEDNLAYIQLDAMAAEHYAK